MSLTNDNIMVLNQVAASLGIPADWLFKLINHESSFNSKAKNPFSSARGLLQWLDTTAAEMGYKDSTDLITKNPDIDSQLKGPVLQYLTKYKPFPTQQSLAMAVFYPVARNWSPDKQFPLNVQAVNPGIRTPGDYVDRMNGKTLTKGATQEGFYIVLLLILLIAGYLYYKGYFGTSEKVDRLFETSENSSQINTSF